MEGFWGAEFEMITISFVQRFWKCEISASGEERNKENFHCSVLFIYCFQFFWGFFCMFACVQHTLGVLHYELVPTGETVFCSPLVILLDLAPCNFFGPSLLMRIELKDFCFDRLKEFQLRDKCKWTQQDYYKVVLKLGQCWMQHRDSREDVCEIRHMRFIFKDATLKPFSCICTAYAFNY